MIALFVLKLSAGITLMWWLMPRRQVTDGFFRIQMRVVLGLSVLVALLLSSATLPRTPSSGLAESTSAVQPVSAWIRSMAIASAVVAYAGSVFWALGRRLPGNVCIHLLASLGVSTLVLHAGNASSDVPLTLQLLSEASTAAVLGGVTTGMLLGHWYLTTPTMSIQPLFWFNRAIAVSLFLRCCASAWVLAMAPQDLPDVTQQIWLGIRWLGGIVAPAIAVLMVWRILKLRNTQSATGVLFAALIMVFMGEMAAALLEGDTRIPW